MEILLAVIAAAIADARAADALIRTSPTWGDARLGGPMTLELAYAHVAAAREAAAIAGVSDADLLAIAHHESRYTHGKATREPSCYDGDTAQPCRPQGRWSCGVMTPEPVHIGGCPTRTLLEEYVEGARHLRRWIDVCGGALEGARLCALRGYSGGMLDDQVGNQGLHTWQVFDRRAWWIKHERKKP